MMRLIYCFSFLLIFGCQSEKADMLYSTGKQSSDQVNSMISEEMEMEPPRTTEPPSPEFSLDKGSKIIKTGHMNFGVTNIEKAKKEIDSILIESLGYYENETYNVYGNRLTYNLKIRVPNSKFDSLIILLESGLGDLKSKNIRANDVTEEYVDVKIRLENKLSYLKQYKAILAKAKTIKDILEVQEKIRRLEVEIESKQGRLKYIDDKVNFSTLELEISEFIVSDISKTPNFGTRLLAAFKSGIAVFLNFIVGLVYLWPFILLLIIILFGIKPVYRRIKRK